MKVISDTSGNSAAPLISICLEFIEHHPDAALLAGVLLMITAWGLLGLIWLDHLMEKKASRSRSNVNMLIAVIAEKHPDLVQVLDLTENDVEEISRYRGILEGGHGF